jgi:hypothetical protein
MSAFGYERTFFQVCVMSALPQKRTLVECAAMSALCQKQTPRACASLAIRKLPPWFKSVALLAARRWHDELVASAATLSDPGAIAKLQILRQTQSHFG